MSNPQRLADRLAIVQRSRFVGRTAELELFRGAMHGTDPPFAVLHVYGPGGIGKTTLLGEYQRIAQEAGLVTCYLDGHTINPSPQGFLAALNVMLDELARHPRIILLIDTYETLMSLDKWLRDTFLPQLPAASVAVIAGRNPPHHAWRTTPGWRDLTRIISLRNLHPDESRKYLKTRGIAPTRHAKVLQFTHGHPLALSLVADALHFGNDDLDFDPQHAPDVVRVLLKHFIDHIPSPLHRQALEVCAHVRVTDESMLAALFGAEQGHHLFLWLEGLSFMEHSREGIFPHDVVREVLDTDLRWRDPQRFLELSHQTRRYLGKLIQRSDGIKQQQVLYSLFFLHRHNRLWQKYHVKDLMGQTYAETLKADDAPFILQMVERHEGEASRQIAHYWLQKQPQAFSIFRTLDGDVSGFLMNLRLDTFTGDDIDADPAIRSIAGFVEQRAPLRPGEVVFVHRMWMGNEGYQTLEAQMVVETAVMARLMTTPNLAWNFPCIADPDFWQPYFSYVNWQRSPEADFEVGGHRYGVFSHDWRTEPLPAWFEVMLKREIALDFSPEEMEAQIPLPVIVLSQTEFEEAVRQALRDCTHDNLLAHNPLMRSRLVSHKGKPPESPAVLQALIREAADTLRANPKSEKLYRALYHTYLNPAPTQEMAAEQLDLPFSTYRRHLTGAITRVTEWLWQRELYGD